MATSYQGASGPSGYAGLQHVPIRPVSGNHTAPEPVLTRLQQPSQEQLILNELRKLTVRLLIDVFDLRVNNLPGDTSTLLKCPLNCTRYDPVPLTGYPPDRSAGVACDK
jgi:hypothetical protein